MNPLLQTKVLHPAIWSPIPLSPPPPAVTSILNPRASFARFPFFISSHPYVVLNGCFFQVILGYCLWSKLFLLDVILLTLIHVVAAAVAHLVCPARDILMWHPRFLTLPPAGTRAWGFGCRAALLLRISPPRPPLVPLPFPPLPLHASHAGLFVPTPSPSLSQGLCTCCFLFLGCFCWSCSCLSFCFQNVIFSDAFPGSPGL